MGSQCRETDAAHYIEMTSPEKLAISYLTWISSFNQSVNFSLFIKLQMSVHYLVGISLTFDGRYMVEKYHKTSYCFS